MKIEIRYLICFCVFLTSLRPLSAQMVTDTLYDYSERKSFEIGGVTIVGAGNRDVNAIKSITGLREGERINIPGIEIPKAIKALMKLKLFNNVYVTQDSILDDQVIFLTVRLEDKPTMSKFTYRGVKKSNHEDLNEIVNATLTREAIVTDDQKDLVKRKLEEFYKNKGLLDTRVEVIEEKDANRENSVSLIFDIDTKEKVKIEDIIFVGNEQIKDRKLRKKMKGTKRKGTLFKKSKLIEEKYDEDKDALIAYYNTQGYKNARILKDSLWRNEKGRLMIKLWLEEGNVFKYRSITWKGNTLYTDDQLNTIFGLVRGDVYNPQLLESRLRFSQDGRDISSLYLDDGYLSFNVNPVEIAIDNDSIDIEMRLYEGPQFTIGDVRIYGNDRTHENVIRRSIRTRPGVKFSRSEIIRSQREIIALGYFNPESMDIQTPVHEAQGLVDIEYKLEERSSDQLELSAGYGGFQGLIGTLGVTFNNFSIANIRDRSTWSPLPQGDGQKLSVRVQSNSRYFKSYNFSFTEPWLGGKKPTSLTVGGVKSDNDYSSLGLGKFSIIRFYGGIGSQLKKPDDFFSSSTTLSYDRIELSEYTNTAFFVEDKDRLLSIKNGLFNNFALKQVFARSSVSDPLFPRTGSSISLSIQLTPPYSLFRKKSDYIPDEEEISEIETRIREERGPGNPPTAADIQEEVDGVVLAKRFNWLEYHKWTFNSEWYFNLFDKLVLKAQVKMGLMGYYNKDLGTSPFERFNLGGDGLSNQNNFITGVDIISLRGYDDQNDFPINQRGGATIYDKFTLELRYPLSLNPSSTIFVTAFMQGGNQWQRFRDFNPFDIKRSAGMGARVFLPMFGLLGFDYGFGLDKVLPSDSKWTDFGRFSIVIGFEPE